MKKLLVLRIFKQLQINEGTHRRSTSQPERRNEKIKLSHICYEWCDFCKLVTDRALQTQVSLPVALLGPCQGVDVRWGATLACFCLVVLCAVTASGGRAVFRVRYVL